MSDAWTYGGDLGNPLDLVRYLIGDTEKKRHSPSDTEVDYWIDINTADGKTNAYAAAAAVARHLSTRFRTLANSQVKIGDMSLTNNYANLADQYDDIVTSLTAQASGGGTSEPAIGGPLWGGGTTPGAFSMGLMDNA